MGVGNVLKHDDGVGVRAAEIMSHLPLPEEVEVYDAGSGGLELATVLEGRELVVVVDAIQARTEPGAVFKFRPEELRPFVQTGLSLHDLHLLDALKELDLLGSSPRQVVIFAIQTADVSTGLGLSAPVEAGLRRAMELACKEFDISTDILEQAAATSAWYDNSV
jgi:hydrogenase maturation protease